MAIIHRCDKCKEEIKDFSMNDVIRISYTVENNDFLEELALCRDCWVEFMNQYIPEEVNI